MKQDELRAQSENGAFRVVVLGISGGLYEGNLSSYMVAPAGSNKYVCLDAGSVFTGIEKAYKKGSFGRVNLPADYPDIEEAYIFREYIKGYLISHTHMDHINSLVLNSVIDSGKQIYALPQTIENLKNHFFNKTIWPNMANEGVEPQHGRYEYVRLEEGNGYSITNTSMRVEAFPLSHSENYQSTAFLLESEGSYLLYFGDTGADQLEGGNHMKKVWERVAPLVKENKLKGIMIECSFSNDMTDEKLSGHLNPKWLFNELKSLARYVERNDPDNALKGLKVAITHIKPSLKQNENAKANILRELIRENTLGVKLIIPEQGQVLGF